MQEAVTAEAAQLDELEEPLTVVAAVGDVVASLTTPVLAEIALPRLQAVAD